MSKAKHTFKCCFFFKRIFKIRLAEPSEEIKEIFEAYSENGTMSIDNLHRFMIEYQKESNATTEDAQKIFDSLKHLNIFQRRGLHLDDFFRYLLGDLNLPLPSKVHHDMDAPLSHYYLYTGHNSYLTGNQLSSDSSVEPIIKALKKGVRVIELDLWPNSDKTGVKVCHGGTLTSPVDLIKCLRAINDNAFHASEYPVVITFDDHLTPELQKEVAKMVKKTFGDKLYYPDYSEIFPSPNSLKGKVLISTKPPKEYLESQDTKEKGNLQKLKTSSSIKEVPQIEKSFSKNFSDKDKLDDTVIIEEEDEDKAASDYKQLIAIDAMKLKGQSESWQKLIESKVKLLSISEQQLEEAIKTHGKDIIRFTQRDILRVYPKGMRIDSSNYNPYVGWAHGAQMVAFNMQGAGKYLSIMQGMFRANGGCGYVKKPAFLLRDRVIEVFNPVDPLFIRQIFKVKIYHGEGWDMDFGDTAFDRYSPPDFFVKIGVYGVPADEQKVETDPVMNQWVPVWNREYEFTLRMPELAVLRIQVLDHDTTGKPDFAGQTCLPVSELKNGIRAVPLYDKHGDPYKHTRLLMRFQLDNVESLGARRPVSISQVFDEYSSELGKMTVDDLLRFMIVYQKNYIVKKEEAQKIINGIKHRNISQRRYIYYGGFLDYLFGDLNTPLPSEVHHDMDAPLSHYFLYTSHNFDLTGNQLSRARTVDTIIKALKRGVRVTDLDLWPNSNENSVDVCHGGVLTSRVDLKKCLRAIKDNAFVASEYPLLINFEGLQSLNPDLQNQVAKMVKQTFGKMLYYLDYSDEFPSPNNLKRKVLILTELPTKCLDSQDTKNKFHSENLSDNDHKQDQPDKIEHIDEEEDVEKAAPKFRELIAINTIKMKGRPELWPTPTQSRANLLSISEQQLQDAIKTHIKDIRRFTESNILTVHPNDQCFGSPNYNPCIGWFFGAQMVKQNMQGTRKYLLVMQGMFRANGGCGYVKKSDFLLKDQVIEDFSPIDKHFILQILKVKIYLGKGWNLDFRNIVLDRTPGFFVKIRINGLPLDEKKVQTKLATNRYLVPEWNQEFQFELRCPTLAVLCIKALYEYEALHKDEEYATIIRSSPHVEFAGQTCLPVSELKEGIRAVPLCNKNGDRYKHTRLLMQFQIESI